MSDLAEYLRAESARWTDPPHLQERRPTRRERAERLHHAAEVVDAYNAVIEDLQQLCDEFGCMGGEHRINWLREQLTAAQRNG